MYISIYIPSLLNRPPTPITPLEVVTERWAELPGLYSSFPLAICFTQGSVYMSRFKEEREQRHRRGKQNGIRNFWEWLQYNNWGGVG